jgi:2-hydroxychromene-2-carboxylate isomerase
MSDLEFFLDPGCPFAWITSRWVVEVQRQRSYDVVWRFISLKELNEHRTDSAYTPEYRAVHFAGQQALRVLDQARIEHGNDGVASLYTALGEAFHPQRRRGEMMADPQGFMAGVLSTAGLPIALAEHVAVESHDEAIHADTEAALSRTGRDVGTPILTFHPGLPDEGSFFGPVISSIPRGADAARLWDAVELIATTTGLAELKRSNRAPIDFS